MRTVAELEERLSVPRPELVADIGKLEGDLVVLGAGGKLGPSLVRLALRAVEAAGASTKVTAVSRFTEPGLADSLRAAGAEVHVADISSDAELAGVPEAANVVYLVGAKFGTAGREHATWATNTYLPGRVAGRFPDSRIVALSTGNVYPFVPVGSGGAVEGSPLDPVGEYAMSCLGRERILEDASDRNGTPFALIRLNYAVEMRYGVLLDVASAVWHGEPVDVTTGHANVVWQGYSNEVTLRALHHADSPPFVLNVTGPETVSVRQLAERFGQILDREPVITGEELPTALLSNASKCHQLFGYPDETLGAMVEDVAAWVRADLPRHGKPTKFQRRDGRF
ncbi:NAD-dependent epimerase/dehydratase family protein [Kribbella endophytica]